MNITERLKGLKAYHMKYLHPIHYTSTFAVKHSDILDLIDEIESLDSGWIKVSDRLPEIDEYVLWYCENGFIFQECLEKDRDVNKFLKGYNLSDISGSVTHWQKIAPPKDDLIINHIQHAPEHVEPSQPWPRPNVLLEERQCKQ